MLAVNLKQIAEAAGVSVATASRVLSGSDYPVNEELKRRVLATAEALDYVPNAKARGLLQGNSQTVGVLAGDVSDPYFSAIIGGIHTVAAQAGYLVTIMNTYRDPGAELAALRSLHAHRVDVLILSGSGLNLPAYQDGSVAVGRGRGCRRGGWIAPGGMRNRRGAGKTDRAGLTQISLQTRNPAQNPQIFAFEVRFASSPPLHR